MATLPRHCQPQNDPPVSPQPDPGDVNTSGPCRSGRDGAEDSDRAPLARPGIRTPPAAPAPRVNRWGRVPRTPDLGGRWGVGGAGRLGRRVGVASGPTLSSEGRAQAWPGSARRLFGCGRLPREGRVLLPRRAETELWVGRGSPRSRRRCAGQGWGCGRGWEGALDRARWETARLGPATSGTQRRPRTRLSEASGLAGPTAERSGGRRGRVQGAAGARPPPTWGGAEAEPGGRAPPTAGGAGRASETR